MRERKERGKRRGFAFTISDYCLIDKEGFPPYKQIARSLGVEEDYGHPNIEAMINFDPALGHHTLIQKVLDDIASGARYAPGDRTTICVPPFGEEYTVEFRESMDVYGPCLRAVVLGIAEEYQSLPSVEALVHIYAQKDRFDPFAGY